MAANIIAYCGIKRSQGIQEGLEGHMFLEEERPTATFHFPHRCSHGWSTARDNQRRDYGGGRALDAGRTMAFPMPLRGGGTTAHRSKGLPTRCFIRMRASVRQLKGQDSATLLNRVSVEVQNA
jgi:hypothetical protein